MSNIFASTAKFRSGLHVEIPDADGRGEAAASRSSLPVPTPAHIEHHMPVHSPQSVASSREAELAPLTGREYPSIPYYAIVPSLDIHVHVSASPTPPADSSSAMNASTHADRLPHVQRALQETAARHGCSYYLGTLPFPTATASDGSADGGPAHPQPISYPEYLMALETLFRFMASARTDTNISAADGSPSLCHHVVFLKIAGHPALKDLIASLTVERGRLVLFVSASSRVTQKYLSACMRRAGLELEWMGGAALVWEPTTLQPCELNPLHCLWDAVLNLPLPAAALPAGNGEESASGGLGLYTPQLLEGYSLVLLSTVPFPGAASIQSTLRLVEQANVLAPVSSNGPASIVGRRYVWRVMGPSAGRSVIMPLLVSHVVRCLVEECGLDAFDVVCDVGAGARVDGQQQQHQAQLAGGLAPVFAGRRGPVTEEGASTQSWLALSRLSCQAWISEADAGALGLLEVDEDGAEAQLECEFGLNGIRFRRPYDKTTLHSPLPATGGCGWVPAPSGWGRCFDWRVSVTRIIANREDDSADDIN